MNKNKHFFKAALSTLALLSVLSLSSCDTLVTPGIALSEGPLEISGTWDMGWGSTWTFTDTTFTVINDPAFPWDYSGDVVAYSNDSFNVITENPASGNYGVALLKITAHTGDASQIGSYTIFRWHSLVATGGITTMEYSEAYKAGAALFTDATSATTGMTAADGYFSLFSSATKQ